MISYEYTCQKGHTVWIKHRHRSFQCARFVRCFEPKCRLKMRRTGKSVEKNGTKQFGGGKV
jgi:hypothetical protein